MVQRFSEGDEGIYPDDNGPLVEYEDYAALEELYRASIEHMVAVHKRYGSDVWPALQTLYELSGKDK